MTHTPDKVHLLASVILGSVRWVEPGGGWVMYRQKNADHANEFNDSMLH